MEISHCYSHLVVMNDNFTLLLNLIVKNGNFTLLLMSSSQEWEFHIATDIYWSRMAISRSTPRSAGRSTPPNASWDIYYEII